MKKNNFLSQKDPSSWQSRPACSPRFPSVINKTNGEAGRQAGFTIIELLVVMIVLFAIGTTIGSTIVSTLRGSDKTNTLADVRQNGDYAISQMVKIIRNSIVVTQLDGLPLNTDPLTGNCLQLPPVPTPTVAPGYRPYKSVTVSDAYGVSWRFECKDVAGATPANITINGNPLLNTNQVHLIYSDTGVPSNSCYFACTYRGKSKPTITMNFELDEKNQNKAFAEKTASAKPILFQTTVTLRN